VPGTPTTDGGQQGSRRRSWVRLALALVVLALFNVATYLLLGTPWAQSALARLSGAELPGAFALAFLTNLTVAVPVPYNPIILQMMEASDIPWLIAIATALGASLGEISGFLAGRAGAGSLEGTRAGAWFSRQLVHPLRAFWVIVAVSAPPFPAFDLAGIIAGAVGVRWWLFFSAAFVGRLLRFLLFAAFTVWVTTGA
jgi:membrane protein YqaA with SNARE-associated domain